MSDPGFKLRASQSGPPVVGTYRNVLAFAADGTTLEGVPPGTGSVASAIANDSDAPGANVADALHDMATGPSFPAEHDNGNSGAAFLIDASLTPPQKLTLTANCTVAVGNLPAGRSTWVQLKAVQGGGGGFTITIMGAKTPGAAGLTLSAAAGAEDIISLYWSGSTLYASIAGLAFA